MRIADFGLAEFLPEDSKLLFVKCGTPGYVAPEIFQPSGYDYKVDIFSLGCVFFNMITGSNIFYGEDH